MDAADRDADSLSRADKRLPSGEAVATRVQQNLEATPDVFDQIPVFPLDKPAVRPLDIAPVQVKNQQILMVRDPLGLLEGAALLAPDPLLLVFLEMADGNTTLGEMAQKLTMASGQIIPVGIFEDVARQLDEALLLQTEKFVEALKKKHEDYMQSPKRPYTVFRAEGADRLAFMKELGEEFRRHRMSKLSPPEHLELPGNAVIGILSPHIDYNRGGEAYAWAYQALKEHGTNAKTYIILGTSHRPLMNPFAATRKNYDTPFGEIETDQALLDEIIAEYGDGLLADEYSHAQEHTVELEAIYLKKTIEDREFKIVPILVGSVDELLEGEEQPNQEEEVAKFCAAIRKVIEKHGDDVAIIGGVDFSHCGPEFGQEELNEPEREKEIEKNDRSALEAIESGDSSKFFDCFRPELNNQNVCSIAPIYVMMEIFKGKAKAKTLTYQQANSPDKATLVSFASVAFIKEGVEDKPKSRIILATR